MIAVITISLLAIVTGANISIRIIGGSCSALSKAPDVITNRFDKN